MKKYELVGKEGRFYRIRALRTFGGIEAGELGGLIEKEENLSHEGNCWVYRDAKVYGNARVSGNASVFGIAEVYGDARVWMEGKIYGIAEVYGNAEVSGNAIVSGDAEVYGNAKVFGNAQVSRDARIWMNAKIYDNAIVSGDAEVYGKAKVYEDAKVLGESIVFRDAAIGHMATITSGYIASANDYLTISNIGSRNGTTTFYKGRNEKLLVSCGCFCGTIDEFEQTVRERHLVGTVHRSMYLFAIKFAKDAFKECL